MWRQKRTTIGRKRSSPSSCDSAFSHTAKAWIFIAALPFHNRRRFFLACRDGKLGMVRKLLGDGAQIDATDLSGRTGLMLACWKGMDGVAGFLLTSQNADIEPLNIKNRSALHIAAMEGNLRCVQILTTSLQSDWEWVNWKDEDGRSALHLAAANGELEVVKYLIYEAEADYDLVDYKGKTPGKLASEGFQTACDKWLNRTLIKELKDRAEAEAERARLQAIADEKAARQAIIDRRARERAERLEQERHFKEGAQDTVKYGSNDTFYTNFEGKYCIGKPPKPPRIVPPKPWVSKSSESRRSSGKISHQFKTLFSSLKKKDLLPEGENLTAYW